MDNGSNDWAVSYGAIRFVEQALNGHSKVEAFTRHLDIVFDIDRVDGMSQVTAVLVNRYTLGLADLFRALDEFPGMNCLVTSANWNSYTAEVKRYGMENGICIFKVGEFFGALHWREMIRYVPPDERDEQNPRRRRSS
jgi:hypothetical protein